MFLINILLTGLLLLGVYKDKEFHFSITIMDKLLLCIGSTLNLIFIFLYYNSIVFCFLSIGLAYLLASAYMDKKTMTVFVAPGYLLALVSVILESIALHIFSVTVLLAYLLPVLLGQLKFYGKGDVPMCMVLAGTAYLYTSNIVASIAMECFMIVIAEILFIIKAIIDKNMIDAFHLKRDAPLGSSILIATYIMLIVIKIL